MSIGLNAIFFGREVGDPLGPIEALSGSKKGSRRSLFYDPYKMRGSGDSI